jgi:hypothetical protein
MKGLGLWKWEHEEVLWFGFCFGMFFIFQFFILDVGCRIIVSLQR